MTAPANPVREPSCADWVERQIGRVLTDDQRVACEVLVQGLNTGIWNVQVNWKKVDWSGRGGRFLLFSGGLGTFDFDHLTRLVIAAHDRCMRVEIVGVATRYLHVHVHRRVREGDWSARHPTMEEAIAKFRGEPQ